ncbi:MAG: RagB/SusD family nutrient uptake outer membrane protein [Bacteroidales bacterium]|nr:RagB/SusD family nutrient uptake outer membrane protein [Bacteroidales bacterium]
MKRILILFIAALLISCEDILDVTPLDRISESSVWTDENLVQAYVNAQYNVVQDAYGNYFEACTDEAYIFNNAGHSWGFRENTITADDGLSGELAFWSGGYSTLRNIAIFFEKIDQTENFDPDIVIQLKAEMAFLRAYIYQIFLYSYGGVPIIDKVYTLTEELTGVTRNTFQEVYEYIMDDLDYVIENMVDKQPSSNWGRASADVARALKSRLLLRDASKHYNPGNNQAKWQAASDAAWELIESERYSLWTGDYPEMFWTVGHSEAIWQKLRTTASRTNYPYWNNAPTVGGYGNRQPTENLSRAYEMQANGLLPYTDEFSLTPTVTPGSGFDPEQYWVGRDPRWYSIVGYNGREWSTGVIETWKGRVTQDASYTGSYSVRFLNPAWPWSASYPYDPPYTIIRYAEILMNYAEAQYELGFEDVARDYVNMIRERPGVDMPPLDETVTGEALKEAIIHERRVEFPFECLRYHDIRRWEIGDEVMGNPLLGMNIYNLGTREDPGPYEYEFVELLPGFWDDKHYLVPIPYAEIQRSEGSLTQNSGY